MVVLLDNESSSTTVSRTSADEFGVLLTDLLDTETVTWIVKRILDSMSVPLEIDGHEIFVSCSAGISLFPNDGDNADTLLRNANAARHSAKQRLGRNNFAFYAAALNQESYRQLWFESQLHHALELGELYLHYQPKVDLNTGKITSMEALVRWQNEKLGFVSPAEFIPIAERTGLINAIGEWVIRTACYEARNWAAAGFMDIGVAVNLSALQFRQRDLHQRIIQMIDDSGLAPNLLEVEVTETVFMENFDTAVATLNKLTAAGVGLALDDFGTGYSSLAYLKNLPLNTLKIDRSFLSDTVPDEQDKTIISAIIAMAHSMGLRVVAEGVEGHPQRTFLRGLDCDEIQGYLISKPVSGEEALKLLHLHNGDGVDRKDARKLA
jgi:EAL domain-containing protein (putative c-di-GMP-specific phosphodiesterase class I)